MLAPYVSDKESNFLNPRMLQLFFFLLFLTTVTKSIASATSSRLKISTTFSLLF